MTEMESVDWGGGEPIAGTPFRQVVSGAATEGRLVVLEVDMPPGLHVDSHTHADEDQLTIVIEGRVACRVDGVARIAGPGGVLLAPKGTAHELWNAGDGFAKVLELYTPSGFERVFALAGASGQATPADYAAARASRLS